MSMTVQKSSLSSFCMYVKQRRKKEPKRGFWLFFRSAAAPRWSLPLLPWLFLGLITELGALSALPFFSVGREFFRMRGGGGGARTGYTRLDGWISWRESKNLRVKIKWWWWLIFSFVVFDSGWTKRRTRIRMLFRINRWKAGKLGPYLGGQIV